uniref:hypothetical protein n=1 Tax=Methylogaea oryzae TaxID=1295382 RepID=UPI001C3F1E03
MFAETIPSEGTDQLLYAMAELGVSGYISYALELGGRIDAEVMARAVRLAMDAEPILAAGLSPTKNGPIGGGAAI